MKTIYYSLSLLLFSILLSQQSLAGDKLTVQDAHRLSSQGEILLIDIRSVQEWEQTGIAPQAVTISMHQKGGLYQLEKQLIKLLNGDKSRPIALICAGGVRSEKVQRYLKKQGFSQVSDVPEGMIGGWFTEGWIEQGLPIKSYIIQAVAM